MEATLIGRNGEKLAQKHFFSSPILHKELICQAICIGGEKFPLVNPNAELFSEELVEYVLHSEPYRITSSGNLLANLIRPCKTIYVFLNPCHNPTHCLHNISNPKELFTTSPDTAIYLSSQTRSTSELVVPITPLELRRGKQLFREGEMLGKPSHSHLNNFEYLLVVFPSFPDPPSPLVVYCLSCGFPHAVVVIDQQE